VPLPGRTHFGITRIARRLWNTGIKGALDQHVGSGTVTDVSIAGHSLGAGVATIVAYLAQVCTDHWW